MATEVRGAAFVWTHGMELAELRLTTDDGERIFALRDQTVVMLFDQMWRRRIDSLATGGAS